MGKVKYKEWKAYLEEQASNGSIYLWGGHGGDAQQANG